MSQLIHMRQHIKTVETIKKITHAMRLISMSTHAQLGKQFHAIQKYHSVLSSLFTKLTNTYPLSHTLHTTPTYRLLIVVGSQRGLCGAFNSNVFRNLETIMKKKPSHLHIIPIGKKAVEFTQEQYQSYCTITFTYLKPETVSAIAQTIAEHIFQKNHTYTEVSVLSNTVKSFFVQIPRITTIFPIETISDQNNTLKTDEYQWDTEPYEIIKQITNQYVVSSLYSLLLESLLAEHAARFVSMDSSTRNAEKILETTRLKYNKLRQAKITKEIIELADAF